MKIVSFAFDLILAGFIIREVARFVPRYRLLKSAVANGDPGARTRMYRHILAFEWITALLSLPALGFDWRALDPRTLGLDHSRLIQPFAGSTASQQGMILGVLIGLGVGTAGFALARLRSRRPGATATPASPATRWRRLLPEFEALLPVTPRERLLWLAAAVSAGICEETVFRGWLLAALHGPAGLSGTALILAAAGLFGLAHAYQGASGVILTACAGALFCVLYVVTGSLLVPIALHALVDARFALLPAARVSAPAPPVASPALL